MKFGLSTLLPKSFSARWTQLMSVIDSILEDLQTEILDPIRDQHNISKASNEQILDDLKYFGYTPYYSEGFNSSKEYLTREYTTISDRIKKRNIKESYELILKIFYQKGTVFPLYFDYVENIYVPYEIWWGLLEDLVIVDTLDSDKDNLQYYTSLFFDDGSLFDDGTPLDYQVAVYSSPRKTNLPEGFLDTPEIIETLDQFFEIQNITRYISVQLICKNMLSDTSFFDFHEMSALVYDLKKNKRATEVLFIMPKMYLYTKDDYTATSTVIQKYDQSITKNINSIYNGAIGTLQDTTYIRYGTGYSDDASSVISMIEQTVEYTLSQVYIKERSDDVFNFSTKITRIPVPSTAFSFSEIGLFDTYNRLIYYACFPSIIFPENTNGGNEIYIKIDSETNVNNFYALL